MARMRIANRNQSLEALFPSLADAYEYSCSKWNPCAACSLKSCKATLWSFIGGTKMRTTSIAEARKVKGVSVTSGSRNSYPVYDDKGQKITAWRERAELRLESADFSALSKLTGEMLQTLKMGGMNFSIASDTRKTHEDALLKDAVAAFKARAQLATEALGGSGYKLVSLSLNTGGFQPPMPMRMEAMKGAAMMDAAVTPEIEAGTSQVNINADGVIEVQMP